MEYQTSADNYIHMIQIPPNLPGLHRSCERKMTAKIISRLPDFPDSLRHINTISLGLNFFTFHIIIPFLSYFPVDSVTFHLQVTLFSIHLKPCAVLLYLYKGIVVPRDSGNLSPSPVPAGVQGWSVTITWPGTPMDLVSYH